MFGTTNPAKVLQIQGALLPLGIAVVTLPESARSIMVEEDGQTARENAHKKAITYAQAIGQPVLSMDGALFFEGLSTEKQPGVRVRRIPGFTGKPTDGEVVEYYVELVRGLGGRASGHWDFGLCYAKPDGKCIERTIRSERVFVDTPSLKTVVGYPLESIQIDPLTGKYISEMSQSEQDEFWQRAIGNELARFVSSIEE